MKAIQLSAPGGLDSLQMIDLPEPEAPRAGEITVRLSASSLNYHDLLVASSPRAEGRLIPMSDSAGLVVAVGEGVEEFGAGDTVVSCFFPQWQSGHAVPTDFARVPGDGVDGFAREAVTLPATAFTHAPKGYTPAEAATLTTAGLTAWRALVVDGRIKAGDTVLVLGSGGVSVLALQMARAMGARVIATRLQRGEGRAAARARGRDRHRLQDHARLGRCGAGSDRGPWRRYRRRGRRPRHAGTVHPRRGPGGHIALIGVLTGFAGDVPTAALMAKQANLKGLIVGSREQQQDMVRALSGFDWRPVVDRSYPLEQIAEAFAWQQAGSHFGKICLTW